MRNLKVLGLALVAVLALGAMVASAASADDLTAESYPATLTGTQEGVDTLTIPEVGTTACEGTTYHGTISAATTAQSVTPTYPPPTAPKHCLSLGFPAEVHTNGCTYTLRVGVGVTTGTVDIVCPAGKEITITVNVPSPMVLKCTIHLPPQTGKATLTYKNVGTLKTREVTVEANVTGLTVTTTKPSGGGGIGACPEKTTNAAKLEAKAIVTGEKETSPFEHVGLFLS
jgi:hypothetical protein